MATIQQVFDQAIHMMDEQSEETGETETMDTAEYRYRTISILNSILPALYPFSEGYHAQAAGRPSAPPLFSLDFEEPDFTQTVPLDDTLALGVLPYALAAHLLAAENLELAGWFLSRYNQVFGDVRGKLPAAFEPISTPYGLF